MNTRPAPSGPVTTTTRVMSLDAFRGITIAAMILVNNPGSWAHVYAPLRHAEWHGWTPTDLIFPFFLFIVGVAMAFAIEGRVERGAPPARLVRKIVVRSAIIVGLGLVMAGFPRYDVTTMRLPGVLQRIGLVYLIASLIVLRGGLRGQVTAIVGFLLAYWALMALVPVPGHGPANFTPEANLGAWLDRTVFGNHLWQETWDPEGLLSTAPAIATTMIGVLAGRLLRSSLSGPRITAWLFVAGWGGILVGLGWGTVFPINKNLWTSSYTVFTAGAALHVLAICYWLIDVQGWRGWARPAVAFGQNAIAVFVLSGLMARTLITIRVGPDPTPLYTWIYDHGFVPWAGPLNGSLAFAIVTVGLWYGVVEIMYRRRLFIKV